MQPGGSPTAGRATPVLAKESVFLVDVRSNYREIEELSTANWRFPLDSLMDHYQFYRRIPSTVHAQRLIRRIEPGSGIDV